MLHDSAVVVTVMTNLGFRLAMEAAGVRVVETAVGDRYVLEALADGGYSIGGEQSGHVIFPALATTGDGLLTGRAAARHGARSGRTLADLSADGDDPAAPGARERAAWRAATPTSPPRWPPRSPPPRAGSASVGRVLVRPSGTEPLIRVMVEAATADAADAAARTLVAAVEAACGRAADGTLT